MICSDLLFTFWDLKLLDGDWPVADNFCSSWIKLFCSSQLRATFFSYFALFWSATNPVMNGNVTLAAEMLCFAAAVCLYHLQSGLVFGWRECWLPDLEACHTHVPHTKTVSLVSDWECLLVQSHIDVPCHWKKNGCENGHGLSWSVLALFFFFNVLSSPTWGIEIFKVNGCQMTTYKNACLQIMGPQCATFMGC